METTTEKTFTDFEKINRNLYKNDGKYYRLFAMSVTPNRCWLVNPKMVELRDIDVATGKDVYGEETVVFECCGTVSACEEHITCPREF